MRIRNAGAGDVITGVGTGCPRLGGADFEFRICLREVGPMWIIEAFCPRFCWGGLRMPSWSSAVLESAVPGSAVLG